MEKIGARVAFFERSENGIIDGFDSADDEKAASLLKPFEMVFVFSQVLDFYGYVVGHIRKFAVESFDEFDGMANAVEEIGIAKRNVLRASSHLATNIFKNNVAADDAKHAFVNGHNRTVAAKMFAAAAGFGGANDAIAVTGNDEVSVLFHQGQTCTVRHFKVQAFEENCRFCLRAVLRETVLRQAISQMNKFVLKFAAENGGDAERAQIVGVH